MWMVITWSLGAFAAVLWLFAVAWLLTLRFRDACDASRKRRKTAAHEAGHVIAAWYSFFIERVTLVILLKNGGGITSYHYTSDDEDTRALQKCRYWDYIVLQLGGAAAEILTSGKMGAKGCEPDLRHARSFAIWLADLPDEEVSCPWQDERAPSLDFAKIFTKPPEPRACEILAIGYRRARQLILAHKTEFDALTKTLTDRGQLEHPDLKKILGPRPRLL